MVSYDLNMSNFAKGTTIVCRYCCRAERDYAYVPVWLPLIDRTRPKYTSIHVYRGQEGGSAGSDSDVAMVA